MKVRLSSFRGCRHGGILSDQLAKVPVYGTVAVVCSLHAAVSHFLDELLVVLLEELQQRLAFHAQPEAGVPQPGGGDIAVGLHQFLVTAVHVHAYPVNRRIDFLRLGALARGTCRFHVPKFRGHVQLAAELLDFAVYRKTAHQGDSRWLSRCPSSRRRGF